jgi:hypothetical protein
MVVLNRMEDLPTMMTVTKLLATAPRQLPSPPESSKDRSSNVLNVHCLRLVELTQRASAVMRVSERHFDRLDPVINVFRTFGKLNEVLVTAKMAIVPDYSFADSVHYQAMKSKAEMVIVPWSSDLAQASGSSAAALQDEFIKQVLDTVESHASVMIDTSLHLDDESPLEPSLSRSISMTSLRNRATRTTTSSEIEATPVIQLQGYQVFFPYFGGKDDLVALRMVMQLLRCTDVKVTVVMIRYGDASGIAVPAATHADPSKEPVPENKQIDTSKSPLASAVSSVMAKVRFPDVLHGPPSSPVTADSPEVEEIEDLRVTTLLDSVPAEIRSQLNVETVTTATPLQYAVKRAKREIDSSASNYHLIIVGRGIKFPRTTTLSDILRKDLKDSVRGAQIEMVGKSCLGDAGEAMLLGHVTGGLLVVQSSKMEDE